MAPTSKLILRLAKKSQRNRRVETVDRRKNLGEKRRNHVPLLRRMLAQLRKRLRFEAGNVQLDIEERPVGKLPPNIFKGGQSERQPFRRRVRDLHSAASRVGADHRLLAGGKPEVKFEPVAPVL